jgi:hypothetical protein
MRFKPKNVSALHVALGGLPDRMHVDADPGLGVSAKTVGDLPLAGAIKISKASHTGRIAPKP